MGYRDHDQSGICASCAALPRASAEAHLGLPTASLDGLGELFQAPLQVPTACGGGARGPGAFDQGTTGLGMPRLGEAALTAPLARRVFRGGEAQGMHERAGVSKTGESAACGHGGHRPRALHTAPGLEGVDHGGQPPVRPLGVQFLCQTRQPCGVCGDCSDVCLAHHLLGWGGPDHFAAPPPGRGSPGSPACLPDVLSQEKRCAPKFGRLESAQGIFTGAA
jgi:hypothetical protein